MFALLLSLVTFGFSSEKQAKTSNVPAATFLSTSIVDPSIDQSEIIKSWLTAHGVPADVCSSTGVAGSQNAKLTNYLPFTRMSLAYVSRTDKGEINYLLGKITAENGNVSGVYGWYMFDRFHLGGRTFYVGVSAEIVNNFRVTKGSLDTGNIFNLGVKASREELIGSIDVAVNGLSGKPVSESMSIPTALSQDSVIRSISDFAVIKSRIFDGGVTLTPCVIAVSPNASAQTIL